MSARHLALVSPVRTPRSLDAVDLTDLWRHDMFLAPVEPLLPNIRLLSLDVFDTLLFRTCERPEDVFAEVGRRAESRSLLGRGFSADEFASLRAAGQQHLYATLGREPRLEDIYGYLPAGLGPRQALQQIEEEVEAEYCILNPSVASLVAHCRGRGITVVLLSDMYLGERRVRTLLAQAGFDTRHWTDRVIVSVDAGGYKMTGALYELLGAQYPDIDRSAMLHIGDNVQADVRAARAAGLHAVHYDAIRHDPDGATALERLTCGTPLPELTALRRLASALTARTSRDEDCWHRVGASVVGPFATALVDWALDQCEADGIRLIAPLMREGHMLAPMLEQAVKARGLAIMVTPLYVSRQAVSLAGARDTSADLMPRLLDHRRHLHVHDVFSMVGLEVPESLVQHRDVLVTSSHAVMLPSGRSVRDAVIEALHTPGAQRHLAHVIEDARTRLVRYVTQVCGSHDAVATLDIGFFGQIQRALDSAIRMTGQGPAMTHLLGFGHGPVREHVLGGMNIRTFAGSYGTSGELVRTVHRSAPVLEQLLQGPEGSTTHYERQPDGSVTPVCETNPLATEELARKAVVQHGMRRFQDLWLSLRQTKPKTVDALVARRDAWARLVHRLIDVPSHAEARTLGTLHDDINFGSRAVLPFCPDDVTAQVAWTGADRTRRLGLASLPAVWPQGVLASVDPSVVVAPHMAASSVPFAAAAFTLARALRQRGVARVVGYGTGDVARAFIDAARMLGIDIVGLVDSNPAQQGLLCHGIPVLSLDDAVALRLHVYTVLSVAHADAIGQTIRRRYQTETVQPLVLDLTHLD